MRKKKLDVSSITNELRGQSVFFPKEREEQDGQVRQLSTSLPTEQDTSIKENNDTVLISKQDSLQASKLASTLAEQPDIIEVIRKVVKAPAKEEVLYVRVTKEEKNQLGDIEYTFDRQGVETTANELGRIAINFLIADYKANGENSILAKVLKRLNS